ncbi:MAG: tRNA uridine-5-carboxymethylaminomethyl(34) synthesis enzyme MnmG [Phycisphaerae bacterium]|nr:tRNA uridine-5-carboxymethylaminomethyl(34) synthesis enzyme MnmG [Phycisphaerae bacterium]
MERDFDIVVIGGGHAGAEAAWASARMGLRTAMVTLSRGTIAAMSCNPAIGGIGKGQMVREIDALGGLMGLAADATGIQFRMLNRSKGPAVWGPRCQSDRHAYAAWVQQTLTELPKLTMLEAEATDILIERGAIIGVRLAPSPQSEIRPDGRAYARNPQSAIRCRCVVVTAGTFLRGLMHQGDRTWPGGRFDEPPAARLSESLAQAGLELARFKTGTCPRLAAGSIDTSRCLRQDGDDPPTPFSYLNETLQAEQVPCWITATNEAVHRIVRDNLHRAPMFTGQISSTGPRYCPSLETKVVRFPDKTSHPVFLEPEGRDTNWVYCNGISTSLPVDVQETIVYSIAGLQRAEVLRFGYAIEYDYAPPTQLAPTLETKAVAGLFLAGQVNGTTGYEEAAAQGLIAGVNAAARCLGREALVLRRDQAYIAVMIDDLVTRGVTEPYRMFTSRAEHRLLLRTDNADRRLTEIGRSVGLADDARWEAFSAKRQAVARAEGLLAATRIGGKSLAELLRRPDTGLTELLRVCPDAAALTALLAAHPQAVASSVTDARYGGYLSRQAAALRQMQELDARAIPPQLDYGTITHLRHEAREKLTAIRPRTLGQALRISGVTPADLTVLAIHLARRAARKTPKERSGRPSRR